MHKTALLFISLSAIFSLTPAAHATTAKELADACRIALNLEKELAAVKGSEEEALRVAIQAGYCGGYLQGFLGGYGAGLPPDRKTAKYCIPPSVEVPEMMRVLVEWLEDHPKVEQAPRKEFILGVLQIKWPCPA